MSDESVFYVGDDPDGLYATLEDGRTVTFKPGEGEKVPAKLAKELLARDDFQSSKPSGSSAPTTKKEND